MTHRRLIACAALALMAACQHAERPATPAPTPVQSTLPAGVVAANPLAVDAGVAVLQAGGDAIDAAVAIQAVLGLVEPQSSGLGGGAFLLYFDAKTGKVVAFDGRETAPAGARPD